MSYVYIFISILTVVISQLLLKSGSFNIHIDKNSIVNSLKSLFNLKVVIAVFLILITPLFMILALKSMDLNKAISFTALNYVFVIIGARIFLEEKINVSSYIGVVIITLGVIVYNL